MLLCDSLRLSYPPPCGKNRGDVSVKLLAIGAAAIALTAVGAVAAEPESEAQAQTETQAREAAEAPQEKKVCRSEKMTGSLTRVRRICMTQREWDELAAGTRRDIDTVVRDANQGHAAQTSPGGF